MLEFYGIQTLLIQVLQELRERRVLTQDKAPELTRVFVCLFFTLQVTCMKLFFGDPEEVLPARLAGGAGTQSSYSTCTRWLPCFPLTSDTIITSIL